ncbi:unnamed protein product [Linum tenue]|uniref:RNase H type-1 domain-containing protein n=1 Tax=Linum tenue TaxID=586396 RepID=A0AAV0NCU9_9ROSI|nr:unnamed protein product [Linum tenue]
MPLMKEASCWSIRDGETTCFWKHPWLDCGVILEDHLSRDITTEERESPVSNCVTQTGAAPPKPELGEDKMSWGLERDGRFRLKSAYMLAANLEEEQEMQKWKNLWKWRGPSRIKHFLWLILHDRIFTNKERARRGITTNANCNICRDKEETTEHILRSCERAKVIWEKFRNMLTARNMNLPFQDWLLDNLCNEENGVNFGVICWNLWKQRNEEVMEGKQFQAQGLCCRINAWINIIKEAQKWNQNVNNITERSYQQRQIAWNCPPEGWIQIQTDGSVLQPSGKAAAGGLLRDHLGKCKEAFVCNLGTCSITSAELKGAVTGLRIAWERGYRRVHLNLDSTTAISIIKNHSETDHSHGIIAKEFEFLLNLDWEVIVSHVYREANFAADFLANRGHLVHFGTHPFNVYDPELEHWLLHDMIGIHHDRLISNTN